MRDPHKLVLPRFNTIKFGKNWFHYRGAQVWNTLPPAIKQIDSVKEFKEKLKGYKGKICNCNDCFLCKM